MTKIINKIKLLPKGVKASIAFFFASIITSGIAYIVTPIYTRILSPEVYGQTSVFLTWVSLLGYVAMFCLSYGVFNNGMVDYPDKRDEYSFSMLILSNIITLVFTAILIALYPVIKSYLEMEFPLVLLMCTLFLFQPAYNFWIAKQRYELKYKTTVIWTVVCAFASPVIAIACILCSDNKLYGRLFGAELTLIVIYIGFYFYLAAKSKWKVNTQYWKAALLFNLPLIPHYLSTYLLSNSNKLLISNIIGDSATAYYSVAQSVAMIVTIVWSAVNSSLIPYTYEKCKTKEYSKISNITMPILTMFAAVCVMAIMFAPEVVAIMATADYTEAIYVIPPIVGGVFFQVQYYVYANIVYYYKKPKYVMFASVSSVVLNLVLGYFLISKFGYLAAGYSTLICYFLQATLDYFAMKKVVKEKVYNMRYIGILSVIVVAIALLSNLVYGLPLVRYGIVLVLVLVCVLLRKKILNVLKVMKNK